MNKKHISFKKIFIFCSEIKFLQPFLILNKLTSLTNGQKIDAIKQFTQQGNNDIDILDDIKDNVVLHSNNISLAPSFPYVIDIVSNKNIRIPGNMFDEIVNLIKIKTNGNLCYC